eukprot:225440-Chlamydomonas_euryale.AAC.1
MHTPAHLHAHARPPTCARPSARMGASTRPHACSFRMRGPGKPRRVGPCPKDVSRPQVKTYHACRGQGWPETETCMHVNARGLRPRQA